MAIDQWPDLRPDNRDTQKALIGKIVQAATNIDGIYKATPTILTFVVGSAQALSDEELLVHACTVQVPSSNSADCKLYAGDTTWITLRPGTILNLTPANGAVVDLSGYSVDVSGSDRLEVIYSVNANA